MTNVVVAVAVYVSCCSNCCCCGSYCCCNLFGAATNYRQSCRCWLFDSEPSACTATQSLRPCSAVYELLPHSPSPFGACFISLSLHPRGKLFKTTSCSSSVTYLHKALHKQPYPPRDSSCWCSTMCNNSHRPETPLPLPALLSTLLPVSPLLTILKLVWVQSLASHTASTPNALTPPSPLDPAAYVETQMQLLSSTSSS